MILPAPSPCPVCALWYSWQTPESSLAPPRLPLSRSHLPSCCDSSRTPGLVPRCVCGGPVRSLSCRRRRLPCPVFGGACGGLRSAHLMSAPASHFSGEEPGGSEVTRGLLEVTRSVTAPDESELPDQPSTQTPAETADLVGSPGNAAARTGSPQHRALCHPLGKAAPGSASPRLPLQAMPWGPCGRPTPPGENEFRGAGWRSVCLSEVSWEAGAYLRRPCWCAVALGFRLSA